MKKTLKKVIIFLFLFTVVLVFVVLFLPKINKKDLKEKSIYNSAPIETNEGINLGDKIYSECPEGCNCSTVTNGCESQWHCGYNPSACDYQSNNYACAYAYGSYSAGNCSNGCYRGYRIVGARCSSCKPGYRPNGNDGCEKDPESSTPTPTPKPKRCKLLQMGRVNMGSVLDTQDITVTVENCGYNDLTASGNNGVSITPNKAKPGMSSSLTYTLSYYGSCGTTGSYSISDGSNILTQKVLLSNTWQIKKNMIVNHLPAYATQAGADMNSYWEYGYGCVPVDTGYRCVEYGWRSCGAPGETPTITPPPIEGSDPPSPACYANASSLDKATKAEWRNGATSDLTHKITKLDGTSVTITKELCVPMKKATYCIPDEVVPEKQEKEMSKCEASINLKYNDGKDCSGKKFYKISCTNEVGIKYDNNDDMEKGNLVTSVNNILPGQGIEYGINLEIKRKCEATFDVDGNWTNAYKKTKEQLNMLKKAYDVASRTDRKVLDKMIYELENKIKDIKQVAIDYNNEMKNITFEPEATVKLSYKNLKGKTVSLNTNLETVTIDNGKVTFKEDKKITLIKNELSVYNYHWDNHSKPKVIKMIFPKSYIDEFNGDVVDDKNELDGGNKLYIDYDAVSSKKGEKSTIKITLKRKVQNKDVVVINNDECKTAIYSTEIKYRPIALTNPFINSEYKKGENWTNEKYDFTKTINSNIWNMKAERDITLTAKQMEEVKNSNIKNQSSSPYLGLCDKIKPSMQDDITRTICDALK